MRASRLPPPPLLQNGRISAALTALLAADAVTLGNRIFLSPTAVREIDARSAAGFRILRHELAHVAQFAREGFIPFLFRYALAYLRGRRCGLDHVGAYRAISFEREAREAEETGASPTSTA